MVPPRPDGARQRAGDRRALRALRRAGRDSPARAVVLPDHRLRRPPARRPRHDRLARARQGDAAQLDRPQRRRRGRVPLRGFGSRPPDRLPGVHHPARHAVRRHVLRDGPGAPRRVQAGRGDRVRAPGAQLRQPGDHGVGGIARRRRQAEDRCPARAHRHEPRHRRADPDVRLRLRADGVRHRRDHGRAGARSARLRLREGFRPPDPPGGRARERTGRPGHRGPGVRLAHRERTTRQLGAVLRDERGRGTESDRRVAGPRGQGPLLGQLQAARLARLAPALLGLPDPDRVLRQVRDGPGPRGPAPRRATRGRGLPAARTVAPGRSRGLGEHPLSAVRRPREA